MLCEGSMNFDEFLQFLLDKRRLTDPEADIRNAFRLFDKDADGYLTSKDLKQVICSCMLHSFRRRPLYDPLHTLHRTEQQQQRRKQHHRQRSSAALL